MDRHYAEGTPLLVVKLHNGLLASKTIKSIRVQHSHSPQKQGLFFVDKM